MAKAANEEVTFLSKYAGHILVMQHGTKLVVNNQIVRTPSRHIEFFRGKYVTSNQEEIDFLRNHPAYGREIFDTETALAATENQLPTAAAEGATAEATEVVKPRTKKGERAAVPAKLTTAEDVLDE